MNVRAIVAVSAVGLVAVACGPREGGPVDDGTWVGTITTEGNVTTVANQSGSVWGGTASLVEEASIGVESGGDAYMLGRVAAIYAASDRIFVVDWQVPAVRVYDLAGEHLLDAGRQGQGPGEYVIPVDAAATAAGDILVMQRNMRLDVFAPDGTPKATWTTGLPFEVGFGGVLTVGFDEAVWVPHFDRDTERLARIRYGPDGFFGEPLLQPEQTWDQECLVYERDGAPRRFCELPFAPAATIAFDPGLPNHKPAYVRLIPDRNGRFWVMREGASRQSSQCAEDEDTCWVPEGYWLDAFDTDGRFLGAVPFEDIPVAPLFIGGDTIVAALADDAGVVRVKRYRLVLPGEEGQ